MNRTEARERIMQLLYQMDIQGDYSRECRERYLEANFRKNSQREYADQLSDAVAAHIGEIDERLNAISSKWNTKRMAKVDLAIARLALGEIFYMDAIPDAVAINEAVDLAKKYSTDESRRFINGILGQIVKKKDEPNSELDIGN